MLNLKRITGGLFVLVILLSALAIGVPVGAAGAGCATACANGGYARYVDEDGDRFPDQQTCTGWIAGHPGESPLINMAKLCSHGAHILYIDDGNSFADEDACLGWVAEHPGTPPTAADDGADDDDA